MDPHSFVHDGVSYEVRIERVEGAWLGHVYRGSLRLGTPARIEDQTATLTGMTDEDAVRQALIAMVEFIVPSPQWQGSIFPRVAVPYTHNGATYEIWPEAHNHSMRAVIFRDGIEIGTTPGVPWPDNVSSDAEDDAAIEQAKWLIRSGFNASSRMQ
jgi:hypothetical protein